MALQVEIQRAEKLAAHQASQIYEAFGESLRVPLTRLLGWGRAAGADFVEFFLERRAELNMAVQKDRPKGTVHPMLCFFCPPQLVLITKRSTSFRPSTS